MLILDWRLGPMTTDDSPWTSCTPFFAGYIVVRGDEIEIVLEVCSPCVAVKVLGSENAGRMNGPAGSGIPLTESNG